MRAMPKLSGVLARQLQAALKGRLNSNLAAL